MSNPYDYAIDPDGDATANKVLRLVGSNRRVLELGTAAGVMTSAMHRQGCRVTGIEYVAHMARQAEQWCERMIVADLESLDFDEVLGRERFDVVVAADVLEHLRAPERLLASVRPLLADSGRIVISVPNVGYAGVVAALMAGNFRYREKGLLDRTHLRFFTRCSLESALLETGWIPMEWDAYRVPIHASEFVSDWLQLDPARRDLLGQRPDADIYQFVVVATPAHDVGIAARLLAKVASLEARLQNEEARHLDRMARHERDLESLREHQQAFAEARQLIADLQQRLAAQEALVQPAWMNRADRRLLPVLARVLHRLAHRLGGR